MQNVKTTVKGDKLTIEVDLSERHGLSKSEKNETIATTAGNVEVAPGIILGVNCYTPVK